MITDLNIYIDQERCLGCGLCVDRCIMDNLRLLAAPCRLACPLKINCQGYVRYIAQGKFEEAALELSKDTPFADILGLVCHRPCESACNRLKEYGEPVPIRQLKLFLAENYSEQSFHHSFAKETSGKKISIIGSGPAGLLAAWDLAMNGHLVCVYEQDKVPGGMLSWAIPDFRLPSLVLLRAVNELKNIGVDFVLNTVVDSEKFQEICRENDAVLLAVGCGPPKKLGIPGEELDGVYDFKRVLSAHKSGKPLSLGNDVIVVGGGNAAVDVAICARMAGAGNVSVYSLENAEQMPAFRDELQLAAEKGIQFQNCWGPKKIFTEQKRLSIEFEQCLSIFNEAGDFCPQYNSEAKSLAKADSIIIAIGQQQIELDEITDPSNYDTLYKQHVDQNKVFIAGDVLTGPMSVVDAMASGKHAAESVHRFISDIPQGWDRHPFEDTLVPSDETIHPVLLENLSGKNRDNISSSPPPQFRDQVENAQKCLSCGRAVEVNQTCWTCLPCEIECPTQALLVKMPYLIK